MQIHITIAIKEIVDVEILCGHCNPYLIQSYMLHGWFYDKKSILITLTITKLVLKALASNAISVEKLTYDFHYHVKCHNRIMILLTDLYSQQHLLCFLLFYLFNFLLKCLSLKTIKMNRFIVKNCMYLRYNMEI